MPVMNHAPSCTFCIYPFSSCFPYVTFMSKVSVNNSTEETDTHITYFVQEYTIEWHSWDLNPELLSSKSVQV